MVFLLVGVLPLSVADHEVAVITTDGEGQLSHGSTQSLLVGEGSTYKSLAACGHGTPVPRNAGVILLKHIDLNSWFR